MMGIWSSTLFGSGGALQWNRWQGTLELLVGAPPPFIVVLLPLTLATSVDGRLLAARDAALGPAASSACRSTSSHPLAFVIAVPAAIALRSD